MKVKTTLFGLAAALAVTASVNAQSFNVDIGTSVSTAPGFGAPSAAFGAAAGQAGTWNNMVSQTNMPLLNLAGAATAVTFTRSNNLGQAFASNNANTSGDNELLLDDGQDLSASTGFVSYTFSGLAAGTYNLYVYAVAPDVTGTDQTAVNVAGFAQQIVTGPIPPGNTYILGQTHALFSGIVVGVGGSVQFTADGINGGFGTINGAQLVLPSRPVAPILRPRNNRHRRSAGW
jgi:hypothetical protein